MNQEEKTHWTQDKILLYVKACMSATGLTRMPSRSELSEYYGNDKHRERGKKRFLGSEFGGER